MGGTSAAQLRTGARPRARRRWLWALLFVVLVLVALLAVMAFQARSAYRHLRAAEQVVPSLRQQVLVGDEQQLRRSADKIQRHTAAAKDSMSGAQWSVAARLPLVGSEIDATRTVTDVASELATRTLPELVGAAEAVQPRDLKPRDGRIAVKPIRRLTPYFESASSTADKASAVMQDVDIEHLAGPVHEQFADVADKVQALSTTLDAAATTTRILPGALGGDGPRRYLVLLQNNSEPRTLGGIAGSVIELRADDGRIELVQQRTGGSFGTADRPVLPLTRAERDLYGTQLGRYMQNVTATPDFSRTAALARAHWRQRGGRPVDGVASLDPVALGGLLKATGPVRLPDGRRLRASNAAQLLLNRVYFDIADPVQQDEFFAEAASAVFERITSGGLDVPTAVDSLISATGQGRFLFSSDIEEERRLLAGTRVAGPLAGTASPTVGVFVHDRTQSKMGYYERVTATARAKGCESRTPYVEVHLELTSTAPRPPRRLPAYVTGNGVVAPRGHIASQVYLYAPPGARITSFVPSKGPQRAVLRRHLGRPVTSWPVDLAPGEKVTIDYRIEHLPQALDDLTLRMTPGPTDGSFRQKVLPCGQ